MLQARGYDAVWDMSSFEEQRQYFEGTGVLVLDRVNGVAYVNISERAHPDLAQRWADELGYKVSSWALFLFGERLPLRNDAITGYSTECQVQVPVHFQRIPQAS